MKVCTRCHIEKEDADFRKRTQKRKGGVYKYLNSTCRKCDGELSAEYFWKHRSPELLAKNAKKTRAYNVKNRLEIKAKQAIKRQTKKYKEWVQEYRELNKEKILKQEHITKWRYHEKHRDELTDKYVIRLLRTNGELNPTAERIEIKRVEILNKRIRVEIKKKNHGKKDY